MPDLFEGDTPEEDFSLPGDDAVMERLVENSTDPEVQEMVAEQQQQPRDELGRFASTQEEGDSGTDEIPADAGTPQVAEDPLEKRLADKQAMIDRQANELGMLRQQQAQYEQYLAYQQQQQASPPGDWDSLIDENPSYAAKLAYQRGDDYNYQRAMQAWEDMAPGAPDLWVQVETMRGQQAQTQQALSQIAAVEYRNATGRNVAALAEKYPDLQREEVLEGMAQTAAENPLIIRALAEGGPEDVTQAVETLYHTWRSRTSDTFAQRSQENARKLAEDEQRAIEEASVVSATRTHRDQPASMAEQIAADWPDDDPLKAGWNLG